MPDTSKVESAPLEEVAVSSLSSKVESATLTDEEVAAYKKIKADEDTWLDDVTESELYEGLLETLAAIIDDVLPGPISLFIREVWIEKIARYVFTWALKQIVKIHQDV